MVTTSLSACARIMARQHGAIARSQALRAGLTPRQVEGLLKRGEWQPGLPGVYVSSSSAPTWERHLEVVRLWAGPDAVFCDRTSAFLHGLIEERPEMVEVCSARRLRHASVRTVRRVLERHDVVMKGRLRITHPCRTLIDLAAVVDEETLEGALHLGLNRRLFVRDRLERRIVSLAPSRKKALGKLRDLVNICPERPPESLGETRTFRILRTIAPPMPETQFRVVIDGERFRLDFAYPDRCKGVECDSHLFHTRPDDFERNVRKRAILRRAGWDVLAVSATLVRDHPSSAEALLRDFVHGRQRLDI